MKPPLQSFPIALKSIFMFSLLMVFMGVVSQLAFLSLHGLFGVEKPEEIVQGIFSDDTAIRAFLYYQAVSSLGSFLLTAYLFAALESGQPLHYLRVKSKPALKMALLGIVAILIAQFFIEFLVTVNSKISVPPAISAYQKKMDDLTAALMNFTGLPRLLWTSLVMAVIPAFAEEFFFRGLFLGDLLKSRVNPVVAILLSGLLFSLFHFEFNNFIAIWLLGSFLGYLYYVSGSLWVPIIAHFVNNFTAVLLKYLFNIGVISADWAKASTPWYVTGLSILLFSGCLYVFYRWRRAPDFVPQAVFASEEHEPNEL